MSVDLVPLTFDNQSGVSDQDTRLKETLLNLLSAVFLIQVSDLMEDWVHPRYKLVHEEDQASPQIPLIEVVFVDLLHLIHQFIVQEFEGIDVCRLHRV